MAESISAFVSLKKESIFTAARFSQLGLNIYSRASISAAKAVINGF